MTTAPTTTIQDIRATIDLLVSQLNTYSSEGRTFMKNFSDQISPGAAGLNAEVVINDLVGESVALPGTGKQLVEKVLKNRTTELNKIDKAKDKIVALKEDLKNVGERLADRN